MLKTKLLCKTYGLTRTELATIVNEGYRGRRRRIGKATGLLCLVAAEKAGFVTRALGPKGDRLWVPKIDTSPVADKPYTFRHSAWRLPAGYRAIKQSYLMAPDWPNQRPEPDDAPSRPGSRPGSGSPLGLYGLSLDEFQEFKKEVFGGRWFEIEEASDLLCGVALEKKGLVARLSGPNRETLWVPMLTRTPDYQKPNRFVHSPRYIPPGYRWEKRPYLTATPWWGDEEFHARYGRRRPSKKDPRPKLHPGLRGTLFDSM